VFHNLSGYDAHFIIKEIATAYDGHVELLPITKEKYISFTKNVQSTEDERKKNNIKLRFIDSYKFLTSSLNKLASYLSKNKLRIMQCEFCNLSTENFDLLTRKGVFPYEYISISDEIETGLGFSTIPRRYRDDTETRLEAQIRERDETVCVESLDDIENLVEALDTKNSCKTLMQYQNIFLTPSTNCLKKQH